MLDSFSGFEDMPDLFLLGMSEKVRDRLFDTWVHSQDGKSFGEFLKKNNFKEHRKPIKKTELVTDDEYRHRLEVLSEFIDFRDT